MFAKSKEPLTAKSGLSTFALFALLSAVASGIGVSFALFFMVQAWDRHRLQHTFERECHRVVSSLRHGVDARLYLLESLRGLRDASKEVTRQEFSLFVTGFLMRTQGLQAIEWIPRVFQSDRGLYEESARADGLSNFRFTERNESGEIVPAGTRHEYYPVYYIQPSAGNQAALGFDLGSDPVREQALSICRDTGRLTATPPIVLVQEKQTQQGLLVFLPLYRGGTPTDSVESRRENLEGFYLAVFRVEDLLNHILERHNFSGIDLYLFDQSMPQSEKLLYFRSFPEEGAPPTKERQEAKIKAGMHFADRFRIGGREWSILLAPPPASIEASRTWIPWMTLGAGFLFTAMMTMYLVQVQRGAERARWHLSEQAAAREALEQEVARRETAEHILRESERRYRTLFESATDAILIMDAEEPHLGRIVAANRATADMHGYTIEEILTLNIRDLDGPESVDKIPARVERLRKGECLMDEVTHRKKDGTIFPMEINARLIELDGRHYILAMDRDISDRKTQEEALKQRDSQQRAILDGIPDIAWLKDKESRFIAVNRPFAEACGLEVEEVPGKTDLDLWPAALAEQYLADDRQVMSSGKRKRVEEPLADQKGQIQWIETIKTPIWDDAGNVIGTTGIARDITERKLAQESLKESEERYRLLVEMSPDGIGIHQDGKVVFVNPAGARMVGAECPESLLAKPSRDFVHPDYREETKKRFELTQSGETGLYPVEAVCLRLDGTAFPVEMMASPFTYGGRPAVQVVARDITDRKRAEQAMQESEGRYRSLFENMLEGYAYCRMLFEDGEPQDFVYLAVNGAFERLTGLENVTGKKVSEVIPRIRESNRELFEVFGRVALTGKPEKLETYVEPLGIWFSISVYSTERECFVVVFDNISERKFAEKSLRESEDRFRILAEGAFEGVLISRDGRILDANKVFCERSGYSLEELVGMSIRDIVAPEFMQITMEHVLSGSEEAYESAVVSKDGQTIHVQVRGKLIPYEGGQARIASIRDITAVRRAEEVQKRLATAIEQSAEAVLVTDTEGVIEYVNPAMERITGFSEEELIGQTPRVFQSDEHDLAFYKRLWETIKAGNTWSGRIVNKRKDGSLFHEEGTISPVRSAEGKITNFVAVMHDITEHLKLSNQLLQAQKMEAVGTLAGGIAHDFNNLLQIILGYSELILADEKFPGQYRDELSRMHHAASNGSDLVRRLLTFSRKTDFEPRPLNLNRRIEQLGKILSRTIPKMIEVELVLANDLAAINADPTQMEQILMNLAVNARDAMPEGGRLIIETKNQVLDEAYSRTHMGAEPGHYVLLSVSDTGHGIERETLQHIFEPFFTTKGLGEGTGLGLAMVYGIVKQHGGHIECYSEVSGGTTFKIYFPALLANEAGQQVTLRTLPQGGSETILIADDEEFIRDLGSRFMTKAGYTVIKASNGREALDTYRARAEEISLVILDLIMPEMSGTQCLQELLIMNPRLKVIIASGFSAQGQTKGVLETGARGFLCKPFNMREILAKVREVLDEE